MIRFRHGDRTQVGPEGIKLGWNPALHGSVVEVQEGACIDGSDLITILADSTGERLRINETLLVHEDLTLLDRRLGGTEFSR